MNNNVLDDTDTLFKKCCFNLCNITRMLCFPCHFMCKFITKELERPYAFFFLISFFIFIILLFLLFVLLIQNSNYINQNASISAIFYFLVLSLITNFMSTYYIYYLYGVHSLEPNYGSIKKKNHNIITYTKFLFDYITSTTKILFIGIYYLAQIISIIICFSWLTADIASKENINVNDNFYKQRPIIVYFIQFGLSCNFLFLILHSVLYSILFLLILCKINNSCCCSVVYKMFNKDKLIISESLPKQQSTLDIKEKIKSKNNINDIAESRKDQDNNELEKDKDKNKDKLNLNEEQEEFYDIGLKFYHFIGLFDYEEAFLETEHEV